jgi:hypothetical protein
MAQFARPSADISLGSWTVAPLFSKVNETVANDTPFILSDNNTSPDTAEIALSSISLPGAGTVTVRVRSRKSASAGHTIDHVVTLVQGTTTIATQTVANIDEVWTTRVFTLSEAERNAVTNWGDVRVRVSRVGTTGGAGGTRRSLDVSWIELEAPDATTLTYTGNATANLPILTTSSSTVAIAPRTATSGVTLPKLLSDSGATVSEPFTSADVTAVVPQLSVSSSTQNFAPRLATAPIELPSITAQASSTRIEPTIAMLMGLDIATEITAAEQTLRGDEPTLEVRAVMAAALSRGIIPSIPLVAESLPLVGGTMTGAILGAAGSKALPPYSFSGDTDTGLWRSGADNLSLVVGAEARATVKSTAPYLTVFDGQEREAWHAGNRRSNTQDDDLFALRSLTLTAGDGLTGGGDLTTSRTVSLGTPSTISISSGNTVSGSTHTHAISLSVGDIGATPATRQVTAGDGMTGGGDLTADRTLTLGTPSTLTTSTTNSVSGTTHTHEITGFVPTTRTLTAGDGLTGGGDLTENCSFAVDGTVMRNNVDQNMTGNLAFGTHTPLRKIDVLQSATDGSDGVVIRSATDATNASATMWASTDGFVIQSRLGNLTSSSNLVFRTGTTDRITINGSTGHVTVTNDLINATGTGTGVLRHNDTTGSVVVSGGNATSNGANVLLYGGSHATIPNEGRLRFGTTARLTWNSAAVTVAGTLIIPSKT